MRKLRMIKRRRREDSSGTDAHIMLTVSKHVFINLKGTYLIVTHFKTPNPS
jgi:hypothetical protein